MLKNLILNKNGGIRYMSTVPHHLGPKSEFPELSNKLRLYSCAYCPFSERVRLVLAAKDIKYDLVNVKLGAQLPKWYESINPSKKVPTLQLEKGKILYESLIICEYLDKAFTSNILRPQDPYQDAIGKIKVDDFSKIISLQHRFTKPDSKFKKLLNEYLIEFLDQNLKQDYLIEDKVSMSDYMIWPWLERIEAIRKFKKIKIDVEIVDKYDAYIKRMLQIPAVKECYLKPEIHEHFFKSLYTNPTNPDYK